MEKETIVEVTKLGFTIQATVKVIGKDLLITLTGGDTPHIGTVTTFSRDTEIQTVRFPSHDGRFHKDDVLAEKIAVIIKNAVPGSCTITSGIHVDHISNAQINASFPMSEELGYTILDWLEKTDFHIKEPVYYTDGEKPL
ncbi:amino acid decarboxylase [Enterococcus faecium]|uniref:prenylated flavin chaperone LpdD n=1 Tax=Enterococcus faecium TaxID=1352 RepID=UPI0023B2A312|nr:amino acid decarboxylase [Enterococcus faecium]